MQIQDFEERFGTRLDNKIESKVETYRTDLEPLPITSPDKPPRGWQEPLPALQIVPYV